MVVTVVAVLMMQAASYEEIGMVAVRDAWMAAARTVDMRVAMTMGLRLTWRVHRVRVAGMTIASMGVARQAMDFMAVFAVVLQLTVIQIIHMVAVPNRHMAAARTVNVAVAVSAAIM